jgi:hypothetical protein
MTTEQILRDQLDRATGDVPRLPDLERAVRRGRRQRRTRRAGLALAAVAVGVVGVGLAAGGVRAVTGDDGPAVAPDAPVAGAPAPDYVAGTDIDDRMAAVIAQHLPSLPAPDDVYPSDRHTAGPIPDADFARADDWQATYTIGGSTVVVIASDPREAQGCRGCDSEKVPGGRLYHQRYTSLGPDHWYFGVFFVRPDGSAVNAFESLIAPDEATAVAQRQLSDADMEALVQDQRLSFTGSH